MRGRPGPPRWSADGRLLACASEREVTVCDAATGKVVHTLRVEDKDREFTGLLGFDAAADRLVASLNNGEAVATFSLKRGGHTEIVETGVRSAEDVSPDGRHAGVHERRTEPGPVRRTDRAVPDWVDLPAAPGPCLRRRRDLLGRERHRVQPGRFVLFVVGRLGDACPVGPGHRRTGTGHCDRDSHGRHGALAGRAVVGHRHLEPSVAVGRSDRPATLCLGGRTRALARWRFLRRSGPLVNDFDRPHGPALGRCSQEKTARAAWDARPGPTAGQPIRRPGPWPRTRGGRTSCATRIAPAQPVPTAQINRWLAHLGSDEYGAREIAMHKSRDLGRLVEPELRVALAKATSEEVRTHWTGC